MDTTFSAETIAALGVCGLLAIVIPVAAIIIYKLKNKDAWLPAALIGAGTFLVFALILEQLLHAVMLPIVGGSTVAYVIYGTLAAGVFEETGRFAAYKTLMKNHRSAKNAVMTGLGHGGFEAAVLLGMTLISYFAMAIMVNAVGLDEVLRLTGGDDPQVSEIAIAQLEAIAGYGFLNAGLGLFERLLAMTFHVCLSVIVYKAASVKGKLWLFPAAVLIHAVMDAPAAMYQKGVIGLAAVYIAMTALTAVVVVITVIMSKKIPDKSE